MRTLSLAPLRIGAFALLLGLVAAACAAPAFAGGADASRHDGSAVHSSATDMPYCDLEDLTNAYGTQRIAQLTGDAEGMVVIDAQAEAAINEAAHEIETAVIAHYGSALYDEEIPYLVQLNVEGAWLFLQQRSPGGLGDADSTTRLDLKRWDAKLDDIAAGRRVLLAQPDENDDGVVDDLVTFTAKPRLFQRRSC